MKKHKIILIMASASCALMLAGCQRQMSKDKMSTIVTTANKKQVTDGDLQEKIDAKVLNIHTTSTVKGKFQSKPFKYFGNMDLSDGKHKNHSLIFIENNKYYIKQNGKWKASKNNNVDAKDYKQPMKFLNEKMFKKNIKYSQSGQNVNVSLDLNAKQRQQLLNMLMQDKSTNALDKAMIKDTKLKKATINETVDSRTKSVKHLDETISSSSSLLDYKITINLDNASRGNQVKRPSDLSVK